MSRYVRVNQKSLIVRLGILRLSAQEDVKMPLFQVGVIQNHGSLQLPICVNEFERLKMLKCSEEKFFL